MKLVFLFKEMNDLAYFPSSIFVYQNFTVPYTKLQSSSPSSLRSSLVADGLPIVKGSTGTVTLGRKNSLDGATHAQGSHSETMQNGHASSTKYGLPPIV